MGLDMSIRLNRRVKRGNKVIKGCEVTRYYYKDGEEVEFDIPKDGVFENNTKYMREADFAEDVYELAYWRKANAIHKWFVDNVQHGVDNCEKYRLTKSNIEDLLALVTNLLDNIELKDGTIRNGYRIKKFLWFYYKKYIKVKGKKLTRKSVRYCKEKLPTQKGFYFGFTDYDEYYYRMLVYTKDKLNYILKNFNFEKDTIYYSSSW